jgi:hypothetical protein
MNFITHSTIYALYPHATFESGLNLHLSCDGRESDQEAARAKYEQRGWTSVYELFPNEVFGKTRIRKQAFSLSARWLGDRLTLSIPLDGTSSPPALRNRNFDSWALEYLRYPTDKGIRVDLTTATLKLPSSKKVCLFDKKLANDLTGVMPALQERLQWRVPLQILVATYVDGLYLPALKKQFCGRWSRSTAGGVKSRRPCWTRTTRSIKRSSSRPLTT